MKKKQLKKQDKRRKLIDWVSMVELQLDGAHSRIQTLESTQRGMKQEFDVLVEETIRWKRDLNQQLQYYKTVNAPTLDRNNPDHAITKEA